MFDFHHPWFRPMWRRVVVFGICIGWALFEVSQGAIMWAILFGALGGAAGYNFFLRDFPEDDLPDDVEPPDDEV